MYSCTDFEGCYIIFLFYVEWKFIPFYATKIYDKPFLCFILWEYGFEIGPISFADSVDFR